MPTSLMEFSVVVGPTSGGKLLQLLALGTSEPAICPDTDRNVTNSGEKTYRLAMNEL